MRENERRVRIVNVNKFVKNNGVINYKNRILTFFIFYEIVLTSLMFIDYYFFSNTKKDILETLNAVGGDFFILQRYLILHFADNTLIRDINTFLSSTVSFSIQIPYFYTWIAYKDFNLTYLGQIMVDISIYLTLTLLILVIIQVIHQKKYATAGLHSIYSPIPLILFSYLDNNYHYFKRVDGVKRDTISKDKKTEIIDRFFENNEIYLKNKIEEIDLKIDNQQILFGFYNFYRLSLIKIPQKETKK